MLLSFLSARKEARNPQPPLARGSPGIGECLVATSYCKYLTSWSPGLTPDFPQWLSLLGSILGVSLSRSLDDAKSSSSRGQGYLTLRYPLSGYPTLSNRLSCSYRRLLASRSGTVARTQSASPNSRGGFRVPLYSVYHTMACSLRGRRLGRHPG